MLFTTLSLSLRFCNEFVDGTLDAGIYETVPLYVRKLINLWTVHMVNRWPPIDLKRSLSMSISDMNPHPTDKLENNIWNEKNNNNKLKVLTQP